VQCTGAVADVQPLQALAVPAGPITTAATGSAAVKARKLTSCHVYIHHW
jgi:hypothetical protein